MSLVGLERRATTKSFPRACSVEFKPAVAPISAASIVSGSAIGSSKPAEGPSSVPTSVKDVGSRVAKKCIEKGMLILTTSVFDVIRFIPPLNVTEAEIEEGAKIFREAVEEVAREG